MLEERVFGVVSQKLFSFHASEFVRFLFNSQHF